MFEQEKSMLVMIAHRLAAQGWVANHDGNASLRLSRERFLATPSGVHKSQIDFRQLVIIDREGTVHEGEKKIFSEWELHRAIYETRPEAMAVVHAHPPTATGFAVAGIALDPTLMAEPVVSLGREIPLIPFFPPRSVAGVQALAQAALKADVIMLGNHGVIACGPALETAFLRLELVEHLAKIHFVACTIGTPKMIEETAIAQLLTAREAAGLSVPTHSSVAEKNHHTTLPAALEEIIVKAVAEALQKAQKNY